MTITVRSRTMDDVHEEFKSVHFPLLTLSIDFDEKRREELTREVIPSQLVQGQREKIRRNDN